MLVFKGQPDGRVERRLNKNWFVKEKIFTYCQQKAWNFQTTIKNGLMRFGEVLSIWSEKRHDISDGWCINAQKWYCKG